ncbi:hypothetical protein ACQZV8_11435 [Magnetococcales bacterium HHB-1]
MNNRSIKLFSLNLSMGTFLYAILIIFLVLYTLAPEENKGSLYQEEIIRLKKDERSRYNFNQSIHITPARIIINELAKKYKIEVSIRNLARGVRINAHGDLANMLRFMFLLEKSQAKISPMTLRPDSGAIFNSYFVHLKAEVTWKTDPIDVIKKLKKKDKTLLSAFAKFDEQLKPYTKMDRKGWRNFRQLVEKQYQIIYIDAANKRVSFKGTDFFYDQGQSVYISEGLVNHYEEVIVEVVEEKRVQLQFIPKRKNEKDKEEHSIKVWIYWKQ